MQTVAMPTVFELPSPRVHLDVAAAVPIFCWNCAFLV
jgi:hypothetical protein